MYSNSNIEDVKVTIAPMSKIEDFNREGKVLLVSIMLKNKENLKLTGLQFLLLAKMAQLERRHNVTSLHSDK